MSKTKSIKKVTSLNMNHKERKTTILFVDDEAIVLRAGQRILSRLGYQVIVAKNGEEACEIYSAEQNKIDLVLLDLSMPEMDGEDTFLKLHEIDENVRVVISSGYGNNQKMDALKEQGVLGFIQKPFDIKTLEKELSTYHPPPTYRLN